MHSLLLIAAVALSWASQAYAATAGFSRPTTMVECPCVHRDHAPDWRREAIFRGVYEFEEIAVPSAMNIRDSSSYENDLYSNAGKAVTTRASFVRQQCRAASVTSSIGQYTCTAPDCTAEDFCPVLDSFTVGCWEYLDDFGGAAERHTMSTDANEGSLGSGYRIGWKQSIPALGKFIFWIDPSSGAGETRIETTASYAAAVHHHHVGRFFYGGATGTMSQLIDGVQQAPTGTVAGITSCDLFGIGGGAFLTTATGFWDECFAATAALDDASVCRIAICGIDGCGCMCNAADPTLYDARPRHSDDGGTITCTMPVCNGPPVTLATTTTSTSSTTTSSTSTSSTSTTTTSSTSSTSSSSTTSTSTSSTTTTT